MALYNNWTITKKYAETETAAVTSGNQIEFVRFISSDDKFAHGDLVNFDDLVLNTIKVRSSFSVSSVKIVGSTVTVTGIVNSTGNAVDYNINTLLLVCKYNGAEFLGAATTAQTAFHLPAENESEVTEYTIRPQLTLSNSDTVSTVVDPVAPATNERVDDEVENLQNQIDIANGDRQSIWAKIATLVDLATNQTITGIKTFTQTIVGNISGNAGTATKLQNSRNIKLTGDVIGTAAFDGSADTTVTATLSNFSVSNTTSSQVATYGGQVPVTYGVITDEKGRVKQVNTKTVTMPPAYAHPTPTRTNTTSSESPNNGSSFTAIDSVTSDTNGHVTGVNTKTVTMPTQTNVTGNAGTASKLQTPRKINGVNFDGSQDITVQDDTKLPLAGGTMIGALTQQSISNSNLQAVNRTTLMDNTGQPMQTSYLLWLNPNLTNQTANGFTIGLGSGANTIIGGGESTRALLTAMEAGTQPSTIGANGGSEHAILVADTNVYIGSGYQSGGNTGFWVVGDNTGKWTFPNTVQATTFTGALTGNAATATKLATARTIALTGDVTYSTSFDGSGNVTGVATLDQTAVSSKSYTLQSTTVTDLNNTTLKGWYYIAASQDLTNEPYSSGAYYLEQAWNGTQLIQRAYSEDTAQPALYRTYNGTTWTAWRGYI